MGNLEGENHVESTLKRSQDLQSRDEEPAPGHLAGREPDPSPTPELLSAVPTGQTEMEARGHRSQ